MSILETIELTTTEKWIGVSSPVATMCKVITPKATTGLRGIPKGNVYTIDVDSIELAGQPAAYTATFRLKNERTREGAKGTFADFSLSCESKVTMTARRIAGALATGLPDVNQQMQVVVWARLDGVK